MEEERCARKELWSVEERRDHVMRILKQKGVITDSSSFIMATKKVNGYDCMYEGKFFVINPFPFRKRKSRVKQTKMAKR